MVCGVHIGSGLEMAILLKHIKKHTTDIKGNKVSWEGGYLRHLDTKYPDAFEKVKTIFAKIGSEELMLRCLRVVTQKYK